MVVRSRANSKYRNSVYGSSHYPWGCYRELKEDTSRAEIHIFLEEGVAVPN